MLTCAGPAKRRMPAKVPAFSHEGAPADASNTGRVMMAMAYGSAAAGAAG